MPTPGVRNGSGRHRLALAAGSLVVVVNDQRSPSPTGRMTAALRPRSGIAPSSCRRRAPFARSPGRSCRWQRRSTPNDVKCAVPPARRRRPPCGWEPGGSVTPSVRPASQGSFLPPLLSGPGLRTRPCTQRPLEGRQWRTPTVLVSVHDCFDFFPAAADHRPAGHGRGVVADRP